MLSKRQKILLKLRIELLFQKNEDEVNAIEEELRDHIYNKLKKIMKISTLY
ncbi:hypothetical protein J4710_08855 [Staphylococcus xylosus]|uniref:Uncharacterized protein n=1 Tax=Staphylococcus xylosus TaxID=1288 RepID=A0A939NH41_STAXY|nr:hypothetical protein [Staphylococcus xylosus]